MAPMPSKKQAAKQKRKQRQDQLHEAKPGEAELPWAARRGDLKAITRLIDASTDVNELTTGSPPDNYRQSGAVVNRFDAKAASQFGGVNLAELAQPPIRTTALCMAVAHKQEDAVKLLLERGADPNIADSNGFSPLMDACARMLHKIILMLFDPGASPTPACQLLSLGCVSNALALCRREPHPDAPRAPRLHRQGGLVRHDRWPAWLLRCSRRPCAVNHAGRHSTTPVPRASPTSPTRSSCRAARQTSGTRAGSRHATARG